MIYIILFSICFFAIDLVSKVIIINKLTPNNTLEIIPNFFNLTYVFNYGAAWNILENSRLLLIIISLIIIGYIIIYLIRIKKYSKLEIIIFSLILGGTLGNLFDRVVRGYVIDFLDFKIFNYDYPIFNLADSFIVIGVFLLLISSNKKIIS